MGCAELRGGAHSGRSAGRGAPLERDPSRRARLGARPRSRVVSQPPIPPLRVLHVADKLAMGDSTVHGVTRCLALWVPRYDPARFTVSVYNFGGMDPGAEYLASLGIPVAARAA